MKYLILGAGPAGLAFANGLKKKEELSFLVLEKETAAGGLCRSIEVDDAPLDIGGGHFLDVRRPEVNRFLFDFMPETEWNRFHRDSRIFMNGQYIHHPLEANIWEMKLDDQVEYLKSIAAAGCNVGKEMPVNFVEWIYWKLGNKIAKDYMIPYNQKMFGDDLNVLGTYWLEKLPQVSFDDTLRACLSRRAYGKQPGHAEFFYPKHKGFGEVWTRMADAVKENILYEKNVVSIDFINKKVMTSDGSSFFADNIITTIPWMAFQELIGMPEEMKRTVFLLKYSSLEVAYYCAHIDTDAQWVYFPAPGLPYHRILVRHNFCPGSRGYWTETNLTRVEQNTDSTYRYISQYAYPLNTIDKPQIMNRILAWARGHNVYGLGRWGEHSHFNSDLTVERALSLVDSLI